MEGIERLLDEARQGNSEAVSTLYHHYLPGIFGYVAARVPDRATAEDITSDIFLKMIEGIHQLRAENEAGFMAWLLRIARMAVAGFYRKRERQPAFLALPDESQENTYSDPLILFESHHEADPVLWTEAREDWQLVVNAINRLTEEQRQVLVGRLLMGYDLETVGQMLGKKPNAVKMLQFRAIRSLERLLAKQANRSPAFSNQKEEGE
ncbi:MAG TPA: sigma-70 family RNA polymerase sigma factor [Ktedonobacteraceae bacterium]|nr:sigma-70 family RNA polymerase sigma factor [Ktedonobacteraceae bacterium]